MKKYDETASAVFEKSSEIKCRRKRRASTAAISAMTMCLALTLCVGAGYTISNRAQGPATPTVTDPATTYPPNVTSLPITEATEPGETNGTDQIITDMTQPIKNLAGSPDMDNSAVIRRGGPEIDISNVLWSGAETMADAMQLYYFNWNGKTVYEPLYELLEKGHTQKGSWTEMPTPRDGEETVYAIRGMINEFEFTSYGGMKCRYMYNGKSFEDYYAEYHEAYELMINPLTRDENNIERYKTLKAEFDLASEYCVKKSLEFQLNTLPSIQDFLAQNGISSEIIKCTDGGRMKNVITASGYYIIIYATREQFAELDLASIGMGIEWHMVFHWATELSRKGSLFEWIDA